MHDEIIRGHRWGNNVVSQLEQPYIKNEMERSVLSSPGSSWFILNALFLVLVIFTQTLMLARENSDDFGRLWRLGRQRKWSKQGVDKSFLCV